MDFKSNKNRFFIINLKKRQQQSFNHKHYNSYILIIDFNTFSVYFSYLIFQCFSIFHICLRKIAKKVIKNEMLGERDREREKNKYIELFFLQKLNRNYP
jgi:hypothetical protein